LKSLKKDA